MCDHKNKSFFKMQHIMQKKKYIEHANVRMHFYEKSEESISNSQNFCLKWSQDSNVCDIQDIRTIHAKDDSQNFCLKWSQDSNVCDTQDVTTIHEKDVIVISDSSSKSASSSPMYGSKSKSTLKKQFHRDTEIYILESSDSESTDNANEKLFQTWKANSKLNFTSHVREKKDVKKNTILCTSDESSPNSPKHYKRNIKNSTKSSSSTDSTSEPVIKNISKSNAQVHSNIINKVNPSTNCTSSSSSSSNSNPKTNQAIKSLSSKMKTHNDIKRNLTRKDYQNIIKNIKSTKMVYESPEKFRRNNEKLDKDIIHPAISPKNNEKANNSIIDETAADSESDIVENSQATSANVYKAPLNQILSKPCVNTDAGMIHTELSERKKKQISQWLMTTSPNCQSDTTLSIVPASNRNDVSSGNSSLERLEMNYETPNNRGKIHHAMNENRVINSDCNKKTNSTTLQQATLKALIQSKNDTPKLCTSKSNCNNMSSSRAIPIVNTPQQKLVITDCTDILDKLYGKSWREKADVLFPNSEPRKPVIRTKDRAVQTERKQKNKEKFYKTDSDDDSDVCLKDLKQQKRLTKKSARKNTKRVDSFINDQSSSGSTSDSMYYTALTNPKASVNGTQQKATNLPGIQRALGICDADIEDENNKTDKNPICDIRRRKLSFSSDEIEDSSTSEFDPGDNVPPKPTTKKSSREISKVTATNKPTFDNQKYEKHKSFLASLSESVPIANAHLDARKYRLNYKNNKEDLCKYLFKLYNEKVFDKKLPEDMLIEWNVRMRGTAGFCYNKKSIKTLGGVVKSSRIVLATKILDTPDRLRDTLIHEMCHAAAWLINDVSDGHGPFWTGWANKAMKTFPELPPIRRCHDYKIKTKYTYRCINCGYSIGRHSKSLDIEKKRCGHCFGKFELLVNKTTKSGTVQVQTPSRGLSAFALYVKDNYSTVKKERNIKHAEIMKVLGQQFSAIKIAKKQQNFENDADNSF